MGICLRNLGMLCFAFCLVHCRANEDGQTSQRTDFFDEDRVLRINLDLDPGDWLLVTESVDFGIGTASNPPYVPCEMTIGDLRLKDVAVRRKGNGGLKFDFDENSEGRTVGGVTKLNLHGRHEAGESLAYGIWRDAGIPAPRTGWAEVTVNGEDVQLFLLVEQVDRTFLADRFPDHPNGALFKLPGGEVALVSDEYASPSFRDAEPKEGSNLAALEELANTLTFGTLEEVEMAIDVPAVLRYLAADRYTRSARGGDGYAYEFAPGRFVLIPWDMNPSMAYSAAALCDEKADGVPPVEGTAYAVLSERLLSQPQYFAEYVDDFAASFLTPSAIAAQEDRLDRARRLGLRDSSEDFAPYLVREGSFSIVSGAAPCNRDVPICEAAGEGRCTGDVREECTTLVDGRLGWVAHDYCAATHAACMPDPARCVWTEAACEWNCGCADPGFDGEACDCDTCTIFSDSADD